MGQTNTTLMTVGGARVVHSKHNIIIALLSYTPIQKKPRQITSDALSS